MQDNTLQAFSYREEAARWTRQIAQSREVGRSLGDVAEMEGVTTAKQAKNGISKERLWPWTQMRMRKRQQQVMRLSKSLRAVGRIVRLVRLGG